MTRQTTKLEANHVSISYTLKDGSKVLAVADFTVQVKEGEFVCIVGPSGCGKSTTIGAIAGFLPVEKGEIRLDGSLIKGTGRDRGVVFQQASLWLGACGCIKSKKNRDRYGTFETSRVRGVCSQLSRTTVWGYAAAGEFGAGISDRP